jgi:hypothetical protein
VHKLTNNRVIWGRCALLCGVLLLTCALSVRPYLWVRLPGAVVTFDGTPTSLAAVYRNSGGQLLLWIRESWGGDPFIIYPSGHRVLEGNGSSILDGGDYLVNDRFAWDNPYASLTGRLRGVSLISPKMDIDPRLVFKPGCVEFTEEMTSPASSHWTTRRVCIKL